MSKIFTSAVLASGLTSLLIATTINPVQARGIERTFGFTVEKPVQNNLKRKEKSRKKRFNFFDLFSGSTNRKVKRKPVKQNKTKEKSLVYRYRAVALVRLGDSRLKQPLNQTIPLFSGKTPKGTTPVSNLVGTSKLDDSLAQTIFDTLKTSGLSTKVTGKQKKAIIAFYKSRNFKSVWTDMDGVLPKARLLLAFLAQADDEGMNSADYLPAGLAGFHDDLNHVESDLDLLARLDINLTAMAVRYGQHASGGRIIPNRLSGYHDLAPPKKSGGKILTAIAKTDTPGKYLASLQPQHKSYTAFKQALAALTPNETPETPHIGTGGLIKPGRSDARIVLIRSRLEANGMLPKPVDASQISQTQPDYYDDQLVAAIKEFQRSKKLSADGIIGRRTFAAFNGKKKVNRRNKLVMNMERMRWMPRYFGQKYVFVNQPAFKLEVMQNNRQVWQTKVVVGKPKNQTSFFIDEMETVVFNPYWGVPQSIITKEMLPRLQANPGYLDQKGFEVYNRKGRKVSSSSIDWYNYGGSRVPFSVRQPPSSRNALGQIKFLFPNKHAIYLHDTPSKHLFKRSSRAFSHGCVRVKNPLKFAENILGWNRSRIDSKIATGKNGSIRLKKKIPVYITYFTAWADQNGDVSYFGDIYGRDRLLDRALNSVKVASN